MLKSKKGDTLIEVALAIGILGFVFTAVITTMTSTLSASEYSLEDTMARNEIDIQAEALRYIHNAYTAQRSMTDDAKEYDEIWQAIVEKAVVPSKVPTLNDAGSCADFYTGNDKNIYKSEAFVINTHALSPSTIQGILRTPNGINKIVLPAKTDDAGKSVFQPATIYPRMLYGGLSDNATILDESTNIAQTLSGVEGLWILAACSDADTTNPGKCAAKTDYYDFYIRSCWESANDHSTSTIGTIVRLHNPDLEIEAVRARRNFTVTYYYNGVQQGEPDTASDYGYHYFNVKDRFSSMPASIWKSGTEWKFVGWCANFNGNYNNCSDADAIYYPAVGGRSSQVLASTATNTNVYMIAVYEANYNVIYQPGGSDVRNMPENTSGKCHSEKVSNPQCTKYVLPTMSGELSRSNYVFLGYWLGNPGGLRYSSKHYSEYTFSSGNMTLTLTAQWRPLYRLTFNKNAGSDNVTDMPGTLIPLDECTETVCDVTIPSKLPKRSGYIFLGWSTNPSAGLADSNYKPGEKITMTSDVNLYAIWLTATYSDWGIMTSWTGGCRDIDSYTYLYKYIGGSSYGPVYYGSKNMTVEGTSISLDHDWTSTGHTETTTIDGLGTHVVYFCTRCYSSSSNNFMVGNLRVVISSSDKNYYKAFTPDLTSLSSSWAVFRIMNDNVTARTASTCTHGW